MAEPVRVLVVDDSSFFRKRIKQFLEESPDIRVIGEAANGEEAVRLARQLSPDLITMDVAMPVLDGIEAVRRIMRSKPTAIIMFSALTREGARSTLDALDAGAVDFLPKQTDAAQGAGPLLRQRVLDIARKGAPLRHAAHPAAEARPHPLAAPAAAPRRAVAGSADIDLVLIGASTGGPVAVQQILSELPAGFPHPVLVTVHMPAAFTHTYAERLDGICRLHVSEAVDGDRLSPGRVLIAPGGQQTLVARNGSALSVRVQPGGEHLYKPSVDITFTSAAKALGGRTLAMVLTGMGSDGAMGAAELKRVGAQVWAQDEASCVVYGMPQAVARAGAADRILPLGKIAGALQELH